MENERLTFEQVCEQYEFAIWELSKLVEQGDIRVEVNEVGEQSFEVAEIIRFIQETPHYLFSLKVAERIYRKATETLQVQAYRKILKAKKIGNAWAVTGETMREYMENHAQSVDKKYV